MVCQAINEKQPIDIWLHPVAGRDGRRRSSFKRLEKARGAGVDREKLGRDLDQLDRDSVHLRVPRSMASMYIEFRQAVHDMRDRLNR
jgi:hypothetical protein